VTFHMKLSDAVLADFLSGNCGAFFDGLAIFYRATSPKVVPILLLLHGRPSSMRRVELLFAWLPTVFTCRSGAPRLHSDWPDPKKIRVYVRPLRRDNSKAEFGSPSKLETL
jgi:hypothetical protein